jgi:hypothetical protein
MGEKVMDPDVLRTSGFFFATCKPIIAIFAFKTKIQIVDN